MPMKPISLDRAKEIAAEKSLKPGKVRGTTEVEFTRGGSPRVEIIDWPEFEQIVASKNLEIHEGGGFMKLMKKNCPVRPENSSTSCAACAGV